MDHKTIYWGGGLFDFKELVGNKLLADAFNSAAQGRWKALLPQENPSNSDRGTSIRDDDFEALFSADAFVANFDGADLDSGTVAEFCIAKMLDIPAVLLRTDFRNSNDASTCPDPWNLICSGYPRTEVVLFNAMAKSGNMDFTTMAGKIAGEVLLALDRCAALPPIHGDGETAFVAFKNVILSTGGTMAKRFPDERIRAIVARRYPEC
ncbi:MAG: nucleoside 2-deoxyribosyltransferase [Victivallaceae bacterium]|nr:nucleoside 2-deoxyribosyltransferase [Victivallaceae bacterium]